MATSTRLAGGSAGGDGGFERCPDVRFGHLPVAFPRDGLHRREDAVDEVGSTRPDVLLGRVEQRLGDHVDRLAPTRARTVELLQGRARVLAPRAGGVVVELLVAAAGDVV